MMGRAAAGDLIHFVRVHIDADDVMPVLSEAPGRDGADIAEAKYAEVHGSSLRDHL